MVNTLWYDKNFVYRFMCVCFSGADSIKKYWSRYYQGSQGVVFVLDSASSDEDLETARTELHSALQHPQLCTLPFLILANQQDKPAAHSVHEVHTCAHTQHVCMILWTLWGCETYTSGRYCECDNTHTASI